jgi:hypothetical protein
MGDFISSTFGVIFLVIAGLIAIAILNPEVAEQVFSILLLPIKVFYDGVLVIIKILGDIIKDIINLILTGKFIGILRELIKLFKEIL